jgi:hypothetical protein
MANIFTLENIEEFSEKIDIDGLYDKKKRHDYNKLELFNKILNRIHVKIRTTSRQKLDEQYCWYVVPEIIIGIPKYDQGNCIAYLMDKLKENGFIVRYFHPNTLFISWQNYVPSYVRDELKKKTGIVIDEYGMKVENNDNKRKKIENKNPNNYMFDYNEKQNMNVDLETNMNTNLNMNSKKFTPINSYKPKGNLIYNENLISKLEDKFN